MIYSKLIAYAYALPLKILYVFVPNPDLSYAECNARALIRLRHGSTRLGIQGRSEQDATGDYILPLGEFSIILLFIY